MYNPSDVGKKGSLFGLPYSQQEADLVILPVNLDVTTSYRDGSSMSPQLIVDESSQLDLSLPGVVDPWKLKIALGEELIDKDVNDAFRQKAKKVIEILESGGQPSSPDINEVNSFCQKVQTMIEEKCDDLFDKGKLIGVLGGDHSSSLGLIRSLSKRENFGILQLDAHMDLRNAYERFEYSHASIMYNALKLDGVLSLTQVGIRDYCEEEEKYIQDSSKKINVFYDEQVFENSLRGKTWLEQTQEIIQTLPDNLYISFDIDGLDPALCPATGTPVPGGLKFNEVVFLLNQVVKSGKKIVGFDLCEVGNAVWDANVGARILYRLASVLGVSQNLLVLK